jgi:hypothetical protein
LQLVLLLAAKLHLKGVKIYTVLLFTFICLLTAHTSFAQYKVKGTVYDSSRVYPIEAVIIMSTAGRGAMTDSMGHYQIDVAENDSIWFSFQGKSTPRYAVLKIPDVTQFDIALRLKMDVMQEVRIRTRNYHLDSLQNRKDYAKIFNFHRPSIGTMTSIGPSGAGIDIDELIRVFQFRKNRETEHFRERLIQEEHDKFIDHRFNKALVKRITGLDGTELDMFMLHYRPTYEFTSYANDYYFQLYIKNCFETYKRRSF